MRVKSVEPAQLLSLDFYLAFYSTNQPFELVLRGEREKQRRQLPTIIVDNVGIATSMKEGLVSLVSSISVITVGIKHLCPLHIPHHNARQGHPLLVDTILRHFLWAL